MQPANYNSGWKPRLKPEHLQLLRPLFTYVKDRGLKGDAMRLSPQCILDSAYSEKELQPLVSAGVLIAVPDHSNMRNGGPCWTWELSDRGIEWLGRCVYGDDSTEPESETALSSDILWGADAIADAINRSTRSTFYLLEKGHIPAKRVGGRWCASRDSLRKYFEVNHEGL